MVTDSRRNSRYLKSDENPAKGIGDRSAANMELQKGQEQ